ncbi:MAG: hypothetical protein Q7K45_04040 [Nanoarchaeota archaeon]|nr:hypothetical protein [Nanoarchaeota archaeon]
MSLDTLAQELERKRLLRQAVLLRSKNGKEYGKSLLHPQWKDQVQLALGEKLYTDLQKELEQFENPEGRLLSQIFGERKPKIRFQEFQPRKYSASALEIHLENTFDFPTLQRTAEITAKVSELVVGTYKIVYAEVHEKAGTNDEMLYDIYKDDDHIPDRDLTSAELKNLAGDYHHKLSGRIARLQRLYELSSPSMITFNELNMVQEMLSQVKSQLGETGEILFTEETGSHRDKYDLLQEKYGDKVDALIKDAVPPVIAEGNRVLKDKQAFSTFFGQWVEKEKKEKSKRVIEIARRNVKLALDHDDFLQDDYVRQNDPFYSLDIYLNDYEIIVPAETDTLHLLWKSALSVRQNFLGDRYNVELRFCFNTLVGLQQIIEGGPITNPEASPISVVQNHAGFPNISYSADTKTKLEEIVGQLRPLLDSLPDISDLTTSTKLRKKKDHRYILEELPKNPLDVTFGNDSGCCIFVPEDASKMQNGSFVPTYLTNPYVRLFGVYRSDASNGSGGKKLNEKAQRMGLVLAFESKDSFGREILACNSLELSRMGISGGNATVKQIVEHAENWLIGYAQQHGYAGVSMGRHSYNTSRNFSARSKDIVDEQLRFRQPGVTFYSDIFALNKGEHIMKTRPNSCYWLWKKE